jgi:hypothetical protein
VSVWSKRTPNKMNMAGVAEMAVAVWLATDGGVGLAAGVVCILIGIVMLTDSRLGHLRVKGSTLIVRTSLKRPQRFQLSEIARVAQSQDGGDVRIIGVKGKTLALVGEFRRAAVASFCADAGIEFLEG